MAPVMEWSQRQHVVRVRVARVKCGGALGLGQRAGQLLVAALVARAALAGTSVLIVEAHPGQAEFGRQRQFRAGQPLGALVGVWLGCAKSCTQARATCARNPASRVTTGVWLASSLLSKCSACFSRPTTIAAVLRHALAGSSRAAAKVCGLR